jgi:hypothetical protein
MLAVSWRFQHPAQEAITFMAFEVDKLVWRVFTRCVERSMINHAQEIAHQNLIGFLPSSVASLVTSYLECMSALHVLLYIINLFEPLRCEKDLVFDPILLCYICVLIPRVVTKNSLFYKPLDAQFDSRSFLHAQKTHHKKCNDFMLQFINDHMF